MRDDTNGERPGVHSSPAASDTQPQRPPASGAAEAEFERLYRDYHARIYNLTARIVGDLDEAADITQDVFLRAYSHPIDTSDGRSAEPWLYRIAVNASYDHLRRRAAHPAASLDSVPELAAAGDGFAGAETTRLVESCLATLSPRYRTALVLKDLHGLSNAEIADVMGLHHGAARVLLHRARAAFRRTFRGTAPGKASGISTLGLAAFLPELPVPVSLQMPSWASLAPAGSGLAPSLHPVAPSVHPVAPPAGGEQVALSAGAPAAAIPVAAAPVAQAGLLAGLGSVAGVKTAVAVVAAVVVAGGGAAIGHYSEPADPGVPAASVQTAAPAGPGPATSGDGRRHRELVQARLGLTGLAAAIGGHSRGAGGTRAGDGSGAGQRLGGSGAGGGDGTRAGGSGAGGTTGGSTGTSSSGSGGAGSGGAGDGAGTGGTTGGGDTGTGSGTGGTDAGGSGGGTGGDGGTSGSGTGGTGSGGSGGTGTGAGG